MSTQINMRPPHIDEIFSGKQAATPPAPGTTNWLPIAYAVGGIIVGGIALYLVVDAATKRQSELMIAEMKRHYAEQQAALNEHRQLIEKQAQQQSALADDTKKRLDQYELLLSKRFDAMKQEQPLTEA